MAWRHVPLPWAAGWASAELISAVRHSKDVRFEEDQPLSPTVKRCGPQLWIVQWSVVRGPENGTKYDKQSIFMTTHSGDRRIQRGHTPTSRETTKLS